MVWESPSQDRVFSGMRLFSVKTQSPKQSQGEPPPGTLADARVERIQSSLPQPSTPAASPVILTARQMAV